MAFYALLGKIMGIILSTDDEIQFETESEIDTDTESEPAIETESEPAIETEIRFGTSQQELYTQLDMNSEDLYVQLKTVIHGEHANEVTGKIVTSVRDHMIEQLPTISNSEELNQRYQAILEEVYPQIQDFCDELAKDYQLHADYKVKTIYDATE